MDQNQVEGYAQAAGTYVASQQHRQNSCLGPFLLKSAPGEHEGQGCLTFSVI